MTARARRGLLLAAILVPAGLAAACDGILGIPSDVELGTDAAAEGGTHGPLDGGHGGSDATVDGASLTDATSGQDGALGGDDGSSGDGAGPDGGGGGDGSTDAGPDTSCDPLAAFAPGVPIAELNDSGLDQGSVRLSADERMIAFTRNQGTAASPEFDLYSALRPDGGVFGAPVPISGTNTVAQEYSPNLSDNLLSIVFERQVANGDSMLFYATRTSATGAFSEAQLLGGIAASSYTAQPFARGDLTTVTYVQADNEMEIEVYNGVAAGAGGVTGSYASSVLLPATVTGPGKNAPVLSADGKYVYYSDEAGDGGTDLDMYVVAVDDTSHPHALTALNTVHDERCGWISLDSCRLYYDSDAVHPGGARWLYVASRPHP